MGQGHDSSLLYLREMLQFDLRDAAGMHPQLREMASFLNGQRPNCKSYSRPSHGKGGSIYDCIEVSFGFVLFVGRLHPVAGVQRRRRGEAGFDPKFHVYDVQQLADMLKEHDEEIDIFSEPRRRRHFGSVQGMVQTFFELDGNDRFMAMCLEHKLPAASLMGAQLVLHPRLADVSFYLKVDHFQAFQEVAMFLGNIAAPDRIPVNIEDKYRVQQHGFDRYSFRRRPQQA